MRALPRTITVYEGKTFDVPLADRAYLHGVLGGNLVLRHGGIAIRRVVGHATLPSGTILRVRSLKASAWSILTWVAYCDPTLAPLRFLPPGDELGDSGDLAALTARLFTSELLRVAAAHGLPRAYACRAVDAGVVRGRIDFARLARARSQHGAIACLVWERAPELMITRWLASALRAIEADAVMREAAADGLPRAMALLDGVPLLPRTRRTRERPALPRHLHHLDRVLALADLILRRSNLDEGFRERGASFFIDLERLFEHTIVRAFREAGVEAIAKHPVTYQERTDSGTVTRTMQIDLYVPGLDGGLVIDAKYKHKRSAANLQQVVTYCYLTGATHAVLVYPASHLPARATYRLRSPSGPTTVVHALELGTDARSVSDWRQLGRRLVAEILLIARVRGGPSLPEEAAPRAAG